MLTETEITRILKKVSDPELGINIVDLGLIYNVVIKKDHILITMTMTTPACPMHLNIMDDIKENLLKTYPEISQVDIDLVWEPAWKPEMMSNAAKEFLQ